MDPFVKRLMLPFASIFFLFSSIWVGSLQAEEGRLASFFNGGGEINLVWNHPLFATGTIIFSAVGTDVEIFEGEVAIADAAAESLLGPSDTGEVWTIVALDGIVSGASALAHSRAKAYNFFLLQNTSDERVTVNFNWSAEWLVSGVIDLPETDRSEMGLQLTLTKTRLMYSSQRAIMSTARMLKERMQRMGATWRPGKLLHGEIFSKYVSFRLPEDEFVYYQSGDLSNEFELTFGPKQTYLFALTAEASGLTSVSVEGCSDNFWSQNIRAWPIDPSTKFADIFGVGPEDMTLWLALVFPQGKVSESRLFFRNAVAALLNTMSSRISYYIDDPDTLAALVKSTFESGNSDDLEELTNDLELHNNVGAAYICKSSLL